MTNTIIKFLKLTILLIILNTVISANDTRALKYIKQYSKEQKVALVIGNGAYKGEFLKLKNSKNDAYDMKQTLKKLGFDVFYLTDGNLQEMDNKVRQFIKELSKGGVGMFYYAGHGLELDGNNYLIPIDADIIIKHEVKYNTLAVNMIIGKMEDSNNRLNIVVLDACRNDPFSRGGGGLAQINSAKGMYISYATGSGEVASDGSGRNGLFTKHLLKNINKPNQTLSEVFDETRNDVFKESGDRQLPWTANNVIGDFYFKLEKNQLQNQQSSYDFNNIAKSKYGLTVNTKPYNAKIQITNIKPKYYDGIQLKKGHYKIKVSKKGYVTKTGEIDLTNDLVVDITLDKENYKKKTNKFSLNINTSPRDAKVQITNIKPKYYDGIKLNKGHYKIRVSKDGYVTKRENLNLNSDLMIDVKLLEENSTKKIIETTKDIQTDELTFETIAMMILFIVFGMLTYIYIYFVFVLKHQEVKYKLLLISSILITIYIATYLYRMSHG